MQLLATIITISAVMPSVLAAPRVVGPKPPHVECVHSKGSISKDPLNINSGIGADVWLNGKKVCGAPFKLQDKKYVYTCHQPGVTFSVSETGDTAFFKGRSWHQSVQKDKQDGYGACQDRKGACIKVSLMAFDSKDGCQTVDFPDS